LGQISQSRCTASGNISVRHCQQSVFTASSSAVQLALQQRLQQQLQQRQRQQLLQQQLLLPLLLADGLLQSCFDVLVEVPAWAEGA
jgi:hypothetical protein